MRAYARISHKCEILCPVVIFNKRSELMYSGLEQAEQVDYLRSNSERIKLITVGLIFIAERADNVERSNFMHA